MPIPFVRSLDLKAKELLNVKLQHVAGSHATAESGVFYFNSSNNRPQVHNGTAFKALAYTDDITSGGDADTLEGEDGEYYLDRDNHTGDQLAATISDFAAAVAAAIPGSYATDAEVSTAIATAIANLVDSSPSTLDTLNELAAALGDDPNFATTITNLIATKAGKYSANLGDGTALTYTVTHNLGTRDLVGSVRLVASPYTVVGAEIDFPTTNTARVLFDSPAPTTDQYRVTLLG